MQDGITFANQNQNMSNTECVSEDLGNQCGQRRGVVEPWVEVMVHKNAMHVNTYTG